MTPRLFFCGGLELSRHFLVHHQEVKWTCSNFWMGFSNKLSFKIAMSGHWVSSQVNVVNQSYMLPVFFRRLLSYLVGMKRRTSRCFICKRDNSHFLRYLKNLFIMIMIW